MNVILWGFLGAFLTLAWTMWSMSRSYLEKGRTRGVNECIREIRKGTESLLGCDDSALPEDLQKAISELQALLDRPPLRKKYNTDPIHAALWSLGRTLADACWVKGHAAGIRRKAPVEGRIRVDLSAIELLQLGGLANLGFQNMMPNAKLLELRRFTGKDDAMEAAHAVTRLEAAIPKEYRPDLVRHTEARTQLINGWWDNAPRRAIA